MKKNLKEKPLITVTDINIGNSVEGFSKFLDLQKDLLHSQADRLQNLVIEQCRLTGVNPLSQEMAAGALSINIGKRPRDLLNPKGVKYMQSVFSIKDTIGKKETRDISALCGVTVTQVREFFAGQRSRVKKFVRLSKEKAIKAEEGRTLQGGCSTSSDPSKAVIDPAPMNSVDPNAIKSDAEMTLQGECSTSPDAAMHVINPTPLNSVVPQSNEAASCSLKDEPVPGADSFEKKFIENIFTMMKKEEKFSGQVKLMESILQIHNMSILYWFVTKGGIMILAAWLNEAALEEQTTAISVIFQVLSHLPLQKALPLQMSAILQTMSRLRSYRASDIASRARLLLSRWSRLVVRNQASKNPNPTHNSQKKKHITRCETLSSEWQSNLGLPEEIISFALDISEDSRVESSQTLKLLQASSDDSNKRNTGNVSSTQTKERRKTQLMEEPQRKINGRAPQVTRTIQSNHGRPMSADDIQKAKMRAALKNGKTTVTASNDTYKTLDLKRSYSSHISPASSPSKPAVRQKVEKNDSSPTPSPSKPLVRLKVEETENSPIRSPSKPLVRQRVQEAENSRIPSPLKAPVRQKVEESEKSPPEAKPVVLFSETKRKLLISEAKPMMLSSKIKPVVETSLTPSLDRKPPKESSLDKLKRNIIPWQLPPEIRMDRQWSLGVGENSKEVEIQRRRIKRDKETFYYRIQDIPSNPRQPWDLEMDYDDSLTPRIPIEQAPEEFPLLMETPVQRPPLHPPPPFTLNNNNIVAEPDMELLAVLLKNPELVFALTSGQAGNLSSEDTVRLLDLIKTTGGSLTEAFNQEQQPCLPSPTPTPIRHSFPSPTPHQEHHHHHHHHLMNEWRPEVNNNNHSQVYAFPPNFQTQMTQEEDNFPSGSYHHSNMQQQEETSYGGQIMFPPLNSEQQQWNATRNYQMNDRQYGESMYPSMTQRNQFVDQPEYAPERDRSRMTEYRNNNYTPQGRRDHGRRDYNNNYNKQQSSNRRWRERR